MPGDCARQPTSPPGQLRWSSSSGGGGAAVTSPPTHITHTGLPLAAGRLHAGHSYNNHSSAYASAAGPFTLGSMSGPVMGCFPVRKLLHSTSSSHQHQQQRGGGNSSRGTAAAQDGAVGGLVGIMSLPARRPDTAAAEGMCVRRCTTGDRPASAVTLGVGGGRQQGVQQQQQQGRAGVRPAVAASGRAASSARQRTSHSSGGVSAAVTRQQVSASRGSWPSTDEQARQQMLKSFLSGQS